MIARIWRGYTTHANAEAYAAALQAEILPGIMKVPGYRGSYLLKRLYGEEVEFVTVMLWESLESLSAFAGPKLKVVDDQLIVVPSRFDEYAEPTPSAPPLDAKVVPSP